MKPKSLLTSFDPPNKKQNKTKQKQKQTSLSGNKKKWGLFGRKKCNENLPLQATDWIFFSILLYLK